MNIIIINGVAYSVLISWGVLTRFAEKHGIKTLDKLDAVANMEISEIAEFIHSAIVAGEKAEGRQFSMSVEDLADLLTFSNVKDFYAIMAKQISGGEPVEVKKKGLFGARR